MSGMGAVRGVGCGVALVCVSPYHRQQTAMGKGEAGGGGVSDGGPLETRVACARGRVKSND